METFVNFLGARAGEASSARGAALITAALALWLSPEQADAIAQALVAVIGAIEVLRRG